MTQLDALLKSADPQKASNAYSGRAYYEQVVKAASMVVANVYIISAGCAIFASTEFKFNIFLICMFAAMHCPCSVSYHMDLAWEGQGKSKNTSFDFNSRVWDLGGIHVSCVAFNWALSDGSLPLLAANAVANMVCLCLLSWRVLYGESDLRGNYTKFSRSMEEVRVSLCCFVAVTTGPLIRGRELDAIKIGVWCGVMGLCMVCGQRFGIMHAVSRIPMCVMITAIMHSACHNY